MSDKQESGPELLARLGDDASKWAAEFRKTALRLGYSDMDEGWLIGWFANAIEGSHQLRMRHAKAAKKYNSGWVDPDDCEENP